MDHHTNNILFDIFYLPCKYLYHIPHTYTFYKYDYLQFISNIQKLISLSMQYIIKIKKQMDIISYKSFFPEEQQQTIQTIKKLLPPPNPIIDKNIDADEKVTFKVDIFKKNYQENVQKLKKLKQKKQQQKLQNQKNNLVSNEQKSNTFHKGESLCDEYDSSKMIFRKYYSEANKRGTQIYLASIFINLQPKRVKLPQYNGMIKDDQLIFDSNFQSGNLMAVYKISNNSYDLLLQNDVNTSGFTQWYNFKVTNKRHNFIAKFNIVNLYKSKSLYNIGMKPIVFSQKSNKNGKKLWRRKGFNIFYEQNQINYEDSCTKCYKTLTFQYDFTVSNDTTQFAHAMPYQYNNLQALLTSIKSNTKVTIKTAGVTIMGKQIPLVLIKSTDNSQNITKKALVILARQHPGQTPGSFIVQQMILELLKHSLQVDFIVWRYDIYIFPMVNIDGVIVGNYRSNLSGYDLNRCWIKTDPIKHPQIFIIKNYIRKLSKKQQIQLILDLHGHSRKMGSFFYGNNFGKNPQLLPYIASKMNNNIIFEDCRFSKEKAAKASTARVVLGNMIKQTGNVFTFEVSFFGNYKDNVNKTRTFSFNEEHYKELGKSLLLAIYKTYIEVYKQQKSLKESIFLKSLKKQIQDLPQWGKDQSESGSDSQAEQQMAKQIQYLQQYHKVSHIQKCQQTIVDREESVMILKSKIPIEYQSSIQKRNDDIKRKISQLLNKNVQNEEKNNISKRLPNIYQNQDSKTIDYSVLDLSNQAQGFQKNHKKQKIKLKIYGQPFELKSRFQSSTINKSKHMQQQSATIHKSNSKKAYSKSKQILNNKKSLIKSYNTVNMNESTILQRQIQPKQLLFRQKNSSLALKEVKPEFSDMMINDIVKVHKLNHSKNLKNKNYSIIIAGKASNENFKLPNIN